MEARAVHRYIDTSPTKMRLVLDLIRGKAVDEALTILHFSPKHAARTAEKVLRSAISNLQNKDEAGRVDTTSVIVKEVFVNGGPTMKRILPAPQGRAFRVRKRSNHVTIVVEQRKSDTAPKQKAQARESAQTSATAAAPKASKPKSTRTKKTAKAASTK